MASPTTQIEREFRHQSWKPLPCGHAVRIGKIDVRRGLSRDPVAIAVIRRRQGEEVAAVHRLRQITL